MDWIGLELDWKGLELDRNGSEWIVTAAPEELRKVKASTVVDVHPVLQPSFILLLSTFNFLLSTHIVA